MAIDGELGWPASDSPPLAGDAPLREAEARPDPVTGLDPAAARAWLIGSVLVGILLLAWFFVAWLALDRHVIDAASESVGSAFALLLLISMVGAFRHRHDASGPDRRA